MHDLVAGTRKLFQLFLYNDVEQLHVEMLLSTMPDMYNGLSSDDVRHSFFLQFFKS